MPDTQTTHTCEVVVQCTQGAGEEEQARERVDEFALLVGQEIGRQHCKAEKNETEVYAVPRGVYETVHGGWLDQVLGHHAFKLWVVY